MRRGAIELFYTPFRPMKKLPKAAAELLSSLQSDPLWVAQRNERQKALQQQAIAYRQAEAPLVAALEEAGVHVASVWDLVNTHAPYPSAISTLLEHLSKPYPERVREGIARALAVPEAHHGWPLLLAAFYKETDTTTQGVKWALACALGAAGTDDELAEVIRLVRDRSLGRNRAPLLQVLARSRRPEAHDLLEELQSEAELADDAKRASRRRRAKTGRRVP